MQLSELLHVKEKLHFDFSFAAAAQFRGGHPFIMKLASIRCGKGYVIDGSKTFSEDECSAEKMLTGWLLVVRTQASVT